MNNKVVEYDWGSKCGLKKFEDMTIILGGRFSINADFTVSIDYDDYDNSGSIDIDKDKAIKLKELLEDYIEILDHNERAK